MLFCLKESLYVYISNKALTSSAIMREYYTNALFLCVGCVRFSRSQMWRVKTWTCWKCSWTCFLPERCLKTTSRQSFKLMTHIQCRYDTYCLCTSVYLFVNRLNLSYVPQGVGTVVSGTTLCGLIQLNDTLLLGPDPLGVFIPIAVKSIHRKRMSVKEVRGGQTASFSLKKIKRSSIRKGMVMVSPRLNPQACWEFEAEILVLHHPTTIAPRYQAMGE